MNSKEIQHCIGNIGRSPSRLVKEDMLRDYDCAEFRRVLNAAMNTFITYGIANVPKPNVVRGEDNFSEDTWAILDNLRLRKLTGNSALQVVRNHLNELNPESRLLFTNIIKRDLRWGVGVKTVNKMMGDFIPTFNLQLAMDIDYDRVVYPCFVDPKFDGLRTCIRVNVQERTVDYYSREGNPFSSLNHLTARILQACAHLSEPWMLDSEGVAKTFDDSVSAMKTAGGKKQADLNIMIFDAMPWDEFIGVRAGPSLEERCVRFAKTFPSIYLDKVDNVLASPRFMAWNEEDILRHHNKFLDMGYEGSMVKNLDALYERKKNHNWMKVKPTYTVDAEVVGWEEGTGRLVGFIGALLVKLPNGKINKVGSGLGDEDRVKDPHHFIGHIVELEHKGETKDGFLRHPVYVRLRDTITGGKE